MSGLNILGTCFQIEFKKIGNRNSRHFTKFLTHISFVVLNLKLDQKKPSSFRLSKCLVEIPKFSMQIDYKIDFSLDVH